VRSRIKPPVLNKLLLKFFKYNSKLFKSKIYTFRLKKLFVCEKASPYLCINLTLKNTIVNFYKIKLEGYSFQTLFDPLVLHVKIFQNIFKIKNLLFTALQNILDYTYFFYWKDIRLNRTKYFNFNGASPMQPTIKFIYLKDFVFTLNKNIFQNTFLILRGFFDFFFFNFFFFFLLIGLLQSKSVIDYWVKKNFFYYSLDFQKSIFHNKYDEIFSIYNWFLTLQTGILKSSKYFVNRNYIFTNSTQFIKTQKIFFLKFFFWNNHFWLFQKKKFKRTFRDKKNLKILDGIYIWKRNTTILPFFINKIFYIHNGNKFMWVRILPGMVGYKLGQFSFTRKIHSWNINLWTHFKNLF
jgi:ribosomal protein S19